MSSSNTPEIRKAINKDTRFDMRILYACIVIAFMLPVVGGIFSSMQSIIIAIICGGAYCAFKMLHSRYFRIIKKTESQSKDSKVDFIVQTCVSLKGDINALETESLKWTDRECGRNFSSLESANEYFDKMTKFEDIDTTILSPVKPSIYAPSWKVKWSEWHPYLAVISEFAYTLVGLSLGLIGVVMSKISTSISIQEVLIGAVVILGSIVFITRFDTKLSTRYLRVVRTKIDQDSNSSENVHIQSFITTKSLDWVQSNPNINWFNIKCDDLEASVEMHNHKNSDTYEETEAMRTFAKNTSDIKVMEEAV